MTASERTLRPREEIGYDVLLDEGPGFVQPIQLAHLSKSTLR